jgi:hypothetical protein
MLAKHPDGTYELSFSMKPTTIIPVIEMENDYGLYVRWVLEMPVFPDRTEVHTASGDITAEEIARQLSQGTQNLGCYV